jgi:two-component system sensor histidine kinase PilS (NtrC family)
MMTEPLDDPAGRADEADEDAATLRRRQLWQLGGRLVVASLLLGGTLAFGPAAGRLVEDALLVLVGSTFAVSLLIAVVLPGARRPKLVAGVQIAWDLALVTALVYLLGGATSGFSFLYGVVVLASALVVGSRATQLTTAVALTLYVGVGLGLANHWLPDPSGQELHYEVPLDELALAILRNLVGFVLVGLLAGNLAERLRKTGGALRAATANAADFARLNEDILRSLTSGLLTTDLDGTIRQINPAGAALLGGPAEAIEGRPASDLLPMAGEPGESHRAEGVATRLDGETFPVGFSCAPLRDADDRVHGTLVLFQDLTELADLREKAERAERLAALGRLSAGLAHEIRNPLGSISGSVELVREAEELSEEDRRLLSLVLTEVDRLNDLVTTMLEVGRPRDPSPVDLDLGALAADVARVARTGGRVGVQLEAPEDPVRVHADPAQLRQVLWNLVKNAIQFSPRDGVVHIEVGWDDESRPCLSVIDEGPGIEPENIGHLFDMFFSTRRHGVGLGLALVRQIVDAHRGEISVESMPGAGARFTVHLPPAHTDASAATTRPAV